MTTRPFKFRAWDEELGAFVHLTCLSQLDEPNPAQTIVQFTGLLDFFGHEIWEGDIIRWTEFYEPEGVYMEYHYEVIYRNGCFGLLSGDDFAPFDGERDTSSDVVVGNRFQHSYLLEQSLSLVWA